MTNTTASPTGSLPATGYVRQAQLIPGIIPVSSATWWRWVKSGKAPRPVKLSERVTAWRAEDIRTFLDAMALAAAQ
jgi:prophage regulatory protein